MIKPKVVIVGGGSGGVSCALALQKAVDVTVIDGKDFYEMIPPLVRATVQPQIIERVCVPYCSIKGLGTFVQGMAADVTKDAVILTDGTSVPYDHLVIATGTSYSDPLLKGGKSLADKRALAKAAEQKVGAAKKVLIVGGGPVGIEVAAEIAVAHPGKDVTLVCSGERLLDTKPARLGLNAKAFLEQKGVKVILQQKATKVSEGKYRLMPSGQEIEADLVHMCFAGKPHSDFFKKHPEVLDAQGYVKVDGQMRVDGAPASWFALGDVSNIPGVKLHYLAGMQGHVLAGNIAAIIKSGPEAKLRAWTKNGMGFEAMFVSLGPRAGTGHLGFLTLPSFLVALIKSRDLFITKGRSEIGLK